MEKKLYNFYADYGQNTIEINNKRGFNKMFNDNSGFLKGMLTGVAVGAVIGMFNAKPINRSRVRFMKKNAGKAMRAVGSFMNNVTK